MGRKVALGCLAIFIVLFLAGAGIFWWFVARPATAAFGAVQDLNRIEEIRQGVRDESAYAPPADDVLTEAQVDRYMAVQTDMRARLDERLATLEARYEEIEARETDPNPAELARAASDVVGILVEATEAQVDALNEHGFSLDEYRWVRTRVLEAGGYAAPDYDLRQLAAGGADAVPTEPTDPGRVVPERNVELVEPHRDTLRDTLPFAWFGL